MNKSTNERKVPLHSYHRFLDEAGDTTFYGKGKVPIVGMQGVSNYFMMGMLTVNEPVEEVRKKVIDLQSEILSDAYFNSVRSIQSRNIRLPYFLHAKDDVPEIRKMGFELIRSIDCHFDAVVVKKNYDDFEIKHNRNQADFYADLLSHLLVDNLNEPRLVLNIARRHQCTTQKNLEKGLEKATMIAKNKYPHSDNGCKVVFNVQQPATEPLINIADYFLWALQRKFEKGESGYADYLAPRTRSVLEL